MSIVGLLEQRHLGLSSRSASLPKLSQMHDHLHLPSNSRFFHRLPSEVGPPSRATVFLDRDGVLVEDVHFMRNPKQVRLLDGAARALRMLQEHYYTIVVTNQSGIARGVFTEKTLRSIHTALICSLSEQSAIVDAIYYCPHLPGAPIKQYAVECPYRKPKPGMLLRASRDWGLDLTQSFMVGDAPRDVDAGLAAGVKSIAIGPRVNECVGSAGAVQSLVEAAHLILSLR